MTENLFNTQIPVAPEDEKLFQAWAEFFDMKVKKLKGGPYFHVEYSDGVDLYWMGANMFGEIKTSSLSQLGPDNVVSARLQTLKTKQQNANS